MDANKIEKFIDAGYTKEDIDLLFSDPKIPEEAPKDPEPAPQDPEPAPQDPATNDLNDTVKMLMDTVADLSNTVKALQQSNLTGAKTPSPKKDSIAETMQSFINNL